MEAEHIIQCTICGKPIDCRDLGQAFSHGVLNKETGKYECLEEGLDLPYSTSRKVGDPTEWTKDKKRIDLN
jgi:hypothetical protein